MRARFCAPIRSLPHKRLRDVAQTMRSPNAENTPYPPSPAQKAVRRPPNTNGTERNRDPATPNTPSS